MSKVHTTVRAIQLGLKRNAPQILLGLGVTGFISSVVMAAKISPAAHSKLKEIKLERLDAEVYDEMKPQEYLKILAPYFGPTAALSLLSTVLVISSHRISSNRAAAYASLYSLAESSIKSYQERVIRQIGENKEEAIQGDLAQATLRANPITKSDVIITGKGDDLCYDELSGRYFKSKVDTLKRIQNEFNHALLTERWQTANELFYEMGLKPIQLGDTIGWSADKGMVQFAFRAKLTTENDLCVVVEHLNPPLPL